MGSNRRAFATNQSAHDSALKTAFITALGSTDEAAFNAAHNSAVGSAHIPAHVPALRTTINAPNSDTKANSRSLLYTDREPFKCTHNRPHAHSRKPHDGTEHGDANISAKRLPISSANGATNGSTNCRDPSTQRCPYSLSIVLADCGALAATKHKSHAGAFLDPLYFTIGEADNSAFGPAFISAECWANSRTLLCT